jgi:hypothetical protein
MIHAVKGKVPIHQPPPPKLGQFYGFFIKTPQELARELQMPEKMRVWMGVLSESEGEKENHWQDVERIEKFLTTFAFQKGFGDLLERVGLKKPEREGSEG